MADDRSMPGSAGEVHDDDELADLLAAELERYATGTVPVVPRPPAPIVDSVPPRLRPLAPERLPPPAPERLRPPAPEPELPPAPEPEVSAPPPVRGRRAAEPTEPFGPPPDLDDVPPAFERPGRRVADVLTWGEPVVSPPAPPEQPVVRRRSGYLPPPAETAPIDPIDRVLPTGSIALPEPAAALLQQMIDDSGDPPGTRRARHSTAPSRIIPEVDGRVLDVLRGTGPLDVPRPLYSDWERSLRSIGRPRAAWEDEEEDVPLQSAVAEPDAPTVAMRLPRDGLRASEAPPPDEPRGRRVGRRRDAEPPPAPEIPPLPIESEAPADDDGIDDVAAPHPRVSAATTGAIDLPIAGPRPRTAPLLIERVKTAILQLPVIPESPTGSGGAGIAGRWVGAFASPVLLLLAFGLGAAGGGPLDALPLLLGAAIALPAALRSITWAASEPEETEEAAAFGRAGAVWAVLLLLARIAGAAGAVFAIAALVSAWVARTGALGSSAASAALLAAAAAGVIAIAVAALPVRATAILVQLLGAFGVVGTVLLVLLLAPAAGSAQGSVPFGAAGAGFAAIGLVLVLCGADVARWRTGFIGSVGAAVGTTMGAVVAVGVGLLGLLVAAGTRGDPADALAAALANGSAAPLAVTLAVVLLASALALPVLLIRSAGAAAARMLGGGERLGTAAAGLLGLAGAFGALSAGLSVVDGAIALAGLAGVPVAAWAGVRTTGGTGRSAVAALIAGVGTVLGWLLCDGLLPGATSPVLALAGQVSGVRGGPAVGLAVAFVVGLAAGLLSRATAIRRTSPRDPADTVEG